MWMIRAFRSKRIGCWRGSQFCSLHNTVQCNLTMHHNPTEKNHCTFFLLYSIHSKIMVWFQIVIIGDYDESKPVVDRVDVTSESFTIADMREAVKNKCAPNLNYLASNQLEVYPPETKVPIPAGTDRCDPQLTVASYLLEGKGQRFIVVASAKQQQQQQTQELYGE